MAISGSSPRDVGSTHVAASPRAAEHLLLAAQQLAHVLLPVAGDPI